MKKNGFREDSVARTLDIARDRWTFLVLREAFFGVKRFEGFENNLGIATNILSDRLRRLVGNGILSRRPDPDDGRRYEYRLTEKGLDLYGVTLTLMRWGDKWLADENGPPLLLHHVTCGQDFVPEVTCSACGEPVTAHAVTYRPGPGQQSSGDCDESGSAD